MHTDLTSQEGFCPGLQKEETLGSCPLMTGECRYNAWQCHAAVIPSSSHLKSGPNSHQHRGKSSSELRWEFNHLFHYAILTFFFFKPVSFLLGKIWTLQHLKQLPGSCFFPPQLKAQQYSMAAVACFVHFKVTVDRVYTCYST